MTFNLELFHFIRPWWLLGFIMVLCSAIMLWRRNRQQQGWHQVVAPHLSQLLIADDRQRHGSKLTWLLPLALASLVLGLAGPSWEKKPQPVYQLASGQVIVLDVSQSMLATDITPNRLTQMRFKAMALANEQLDGETGLIAYAGDAYVISPLTTDSRSLSNLIRALRPDLMPVQGSYPLSALELADRLLREAGYAEGDIYWFTDGIDTRDQNEVTQFIRSHPHRVAILGLGTEQGAPIQLPNGNLLRDAGGDVVVPKMLASRLSRLAALSDGRFSEWRQDQQDLQYLSSMPPLNREGSESDDQRGDAWIDQGPWFIALALLLVLPLIRRGALNFAFVLLCGSLLPFTSPTAYAQSNAEVDEQGLAWHQQLWQTPYQQAHEALEEENYDRAATIATDPWQRGTANYARGNYEQALMDFSQVDSATGYYNQGNALMQLERFDEAANVYQEALERDPTLSQAEENLALAKHLAEQQQRQQQQGEGEGQQQQQDEQQQQGEQQGEQEGEQQPSSQSGSQSEPQPDAEQPQQPETENAPPEGEQAQSAEAQQESEEDGDKAEPQAMPSADQLSEEQRQQMENWLNRIEDDPAVLLQRKMELEARRRGRERLPQGVDKQW